MEEKQKVTMDKIVNLCKSRGFIFPGSDIYGGMGNTWDYGPIGGKGLSKKVQTLMAWTRQS